MFFKKKNYNYKIQSTYLIGNKSEFMFISFCMLIISCLFYASGSFGLLNIFGIRREVQILLVLSLLLLSPVILKNLPKLVKKSIFLMILANFLSECILNQNIINVFDRLVTILVCGILLSLSKKYSEKALKFIIAGAAIFSIMATVQAIIIFFKPEFIDLLKANYESTTGANKIIISHPIELLGFITAKYYFLGYQITRLRSFAAEPSVLVYSFLVPGILALSYKDGTKLLSIPILFFSLFLAQSGVMWISIALGIIAWGLFCLFKGKISLLSILPFFIILIFFIFISQIDINNFIRTALQYIEPLSRKYSVLNKYSSATQRLQTIADYFMIAKQYPFGIPAQIKLIHSSARGLLLNIYFTSGTIGLSLIIISFYYIFKLTIYCFKLYGGVIGLVAALLYGIFIQVLCFSSYGWNSLSGFIILILSICRLEILTSKKCNKII